MSKWTGRSSAVAVVAVVAVGTAGPATAEPEVSTQIREVPAELSADLSSSEERSLSAFTAGKGVRVSAVVDTRSGPEIVSFDADSHSDASAAARLLAAQPSVETAELPRPVRPTATTYQQYGNALVRSAEARSSVDGPLGDVTVAVLDSGVTAHPELAAALLPGWNFTNSGADETDTTDRRGHGTHVAGTIAADAASTVEGVAHGVRLLPVKVLDDEGDGWTDWVADGIIWAVDNGADVINLSLGGPEYSDVLATAVGHARSRGVTVVAAAGNHNTSMPFYPAALSGVVGVSAVDSAKARAGFSNHGSYIDVAAPGVGIVSTSARGDVDWFSGTSMAAPHVAGVAALVEAAAPGLTPEQVERVLAGSTTDLGPTGRDNVFGHGLIDAVRAVQAANRLADLGLAPALAPSPPPIGRPKPLPSAVRVWWAAPADDGGAPVTGYRITTFTSGTRVKVTTAPATARSAVVGALANGTTYRFSVTALNDQKVGASSARSVAAVPRTVPGAPRIGPAVAARGAAVVRWAAPATTGGASIRSYGIRVVSGGSRLRTVSTGPEARRVTIRNLRPGRVYTFRVVARNVAGISRVSAPSNPVRPTR